MSKSVGRACIAAVLSVLAYAPRVHALQLDWQAPSGCPGTDTVLRDIRRLAGSNQGEALAARAIVTQTQDQRWRVVIDLSGSATGHRALIADNCAQLARASALIIALAANPEAALDLTADDPPQTDRSVVAPLDPERNTANGGDRGKAPSTGQYGKPRESNDSTKVSGPELQQRALTRGVDFDISSNAGVEWGSLPTSTGWLGAGFRLGSVQQPLSVGLSGYVTQGTSATFTNGVGASFRAFAAQARFCMDSTAGRFELAGCGGFQLALIRAQGHVRGADLSSSEYTDAMTFTIYRWVPGPLLSINPRVELTRELLLEAGAELVVPATRWQFVVENLAPLFRPANVQYLLHLGLSLRLR